MDLSKLSVSQLRALDAQVAGLIGKHQKKERELAVERIYAVAHGLGLPLSAILHGRKEEAKKRALKGQK